MNTDPALRLPADDLLAAHRHLRLDNRAADPTVVVDRVVDWHTTLTR